DVFGSIGTFNTPATTGGGNLATALTNNVSGISVAEANELAFQAEQAGLDLSDPETISAIVKVAQATVDSGVNGLTADSSLFFNQSGVRLRGILIQEGGVTVGRSFELGPMQLAIGVSAKFMEARTNNNLLAISRLTDGEEALDKLLDDWNRNEETSTAWGIDAGAIAQLPGGLTIGIAGRNLNRPIFASEGPQSYYLTPQARAGFAWQPIDWVTFAFDADLWTTGTRVAERYHTQLMGGGAEFNLGSKGVHLRWRLGAYRNVAEPDEAVTYTTGLGLHFGPLKVDLAVAASLDKAAIENAEDQYDSEEDVTWANFEEVYPERFGATVTLNVSVQF
ncbi:MAG: conjugal transfer protein TraF, partial [Planctomycetota bacterium]